MKKFLFGLSAAVLAYVIGLLLNIGSCYLTGLLARWVDAIGFWSYILFLGAALPIIIGVVGGISGIPIALTSLSNSASKWVVGLIYVYQGAMCIYMQIGIEPRMLWPMIIVIASMMLFYGTLIMALLTQK